MRGFATPLEALGAAVEWTRALIARAAAGGDETRAQVVALRDGFLARLAASPTSPLAAMVARLGLDAVERDLIAVLAAVEHDVELHRGLGIAVGDPLRRRPDVATLARLLGGEDPAARDAVVAALESDQPLRAHRLVQLHVAELPLASRPVRLTDRVMSHLAGRDPLDEALEGWCRLAAPPPLASLILPARVVEATRRALGAPRVRVLLHGPDGIGKASLVAALLAEAGVPALRIDLDVVLGDPERLGERLAAAGREAALRGAALILELAGRIDDDRVARALGIALTDRLGRLPGAVVLVFARHPVGLAAHLPDLVELAVPRPTYAERAAMWRWALEGHQLDPPDALDRIAGRYSFGGAAIQRAARRAITAAGLRDTGDAPRVALDDVADAARMMFTHRLGAVAERIPPGFTWDDLVVDEDAERQLREVVRFAHLRPFLLERWGFARKLPYGRGVSVILAGPPGTGKTMIAQLLARELGYDLYRVDLAQVVNKYVGETEKNLARIFDEAEDSHAVLFFDEADALFSRRTDVKSSNDRYANLEVNFLLQRMETYDGVTVLATNLEQGLDEAFKRRVRFSIQLDLPDVEERERLWRSMLPVEAPVAAGVDWSELARKFEMAGGYIKKAVLRAALRAAGDSPPRPITGADLMTAAQLEYREMGRLS